MRRYASLLALLALLPACGSSTPAEPVPYARLELRLFEAGTEKAILGARVVVLDPDTGDALAPAVTSDGGGVARLRLEVDAVRARVFAAGYLPRPLPGAPMDPIVLQKGKTTRLDLSMFARDEPAAVGIVEGTVSGPQGRTRGALVVAGGHAGITDSEGQFEIFDVPAGTQEIRALRQGFGPSTATVNVTPGTRSPPVAIDVVPRNTGGIAGTVGFGGTLRGDVEVIVAEASTGESVPGLTLRTGGTFLLERVPPGDYVVTAGRGEDGMVPDPEQPAAMVHVEAGSSGDAQLTVVDAVTLVQPTNPAGTLQPAAIPSLGIIQWDAYPDADGYVIELQDEGGAKLWGGFEDGVPVRWIEDTFLIYPAEAPKPVGSLPHRIVVYAVSTAGGGMFGRVIATTEEQRGWIAVVPP